MRGRWAWFVGLCALTSSCGESDEVSNDGAIDGPADAAAESSPDASADMEAEAISDVPDDTPTFAPGSKTVLSVENPDHKDEDPSVILAQDGTLLIAWFSERNGNADVYVKRSKDGKSWTETRVTNDPAGDYFPSLLQDAQGVFHLVWFRWTAFQVGSIWHASSQDGKTWGPEERVTNVSDVDDWTPTIAESKAGDLLVAFASTKRNPSAHSQLFLARKPAGQSAFAPAVELASLSSPSQDDALPAIARRGSELALGWVRCQPGGQDPCLVASSNLFFATSPDGTTWSAPLQITQDSPDDVVDTLPSLYPDSAGAWFLVWMSMRTGSLQATRLPLTGVTDYPAAAQVLPVFEGYSPHVAPTPTAGVFLGVWVEQTDPSDDSKKDVFYRFFSP